MVTVYVAVCCRAVKEIVQNTVYDIFSVPHCTGLFRKLLHCTVYGNVLYYLVHQTSQDGNTDSSNNKSRNHKW